MKRTSTIARTTLCRMKSEIYFWPIDPALRHALEGEARRLGMSLVEVLETMATSWLLRQQTDSNDAAEQTYRHAAAAKWIGSIKGTGRRRRRSSNVRTLTREHLAKRRRAGRV